MNSRTDDHRVDVTILGSTGSIGTQALEIVRKYPERFNVVALASGGSDLHRMARQVKEFSPLLVAVAKESFELGVEGDLGELRSAADFARAELTFGSEAVTTVAGAFPNATVLNGINGGVGLAPTLAALEAGSTLALANKESLVVGAPVVKKSIKRPQQVIPVDSEHSAIAQALMAGKHNRGMVADNTDGQSDLHSLVLTASGGPFRGMKRDQLRAVTAEQALNHPTWSMGPVVTVNSSTLMNKGLEIIEASVLFDVPPNRITPVVHPQSIIHSMVTWNDGSTVAQAALPNMRVPIALGMDWPNHLEGVGAPLGWIKPTEWTFEPIDEVTFPAVVLARECLETSQTHPAVMNAANEVCVDSFLSGGLSWLGIVDTVRRVVEEHQGTNDPSLNEIMEAQRWAVGRAQQLIAQGERNL